MIIDAFFVGIHTLATQSLRRTGNRRFDSESKGATP
jgi:hypothetical protein